MYLGKSYIEQCKNIFITSPAVKVQIQEYYKHNTQEGELYLANSCTKCNILLDYYLFINKREAFFNIGAGWANFNHDMDHILEVVHMFVI